MVYDTARQLAQEIAESREYKDYKQAKEKATANETTAGLLKQYHQLQLRAQAVQLGGEKDDALLQQLQKLGEVLLLNQEASAFLLQEFRLNQMVGDVYKILAQAIEVDLGILEEA
ncbi:MAG: YlbF family regulator [Clostridia bacterium]|nr:YlbF family regulator [Candidatus Pelethousia sp.]NCB31028.1 YlbF family regulator [Clostridia bacterium]